MNQFSIDLHDQKFLEDHRFNGVVVAPGALLCAKLLVTHAALKQVQFKNMIPLVESSDTKVKIRNEGDSLSLTDETGKAVYASLVPSPAVTMASLPRLDAAASTTVSGEDLYGKLRSNGNNYGPSFQAISQVQHKDGVGEAQWNVSDSLTDEEKLVVLIDSLTHIVGTISNVDKQYYLRSIDLLTAADSLPIPSSLTVKAVVKASGEGVFSGEFEAIDANGNNLLSASGVTIFADANQKSTENISITGTFTLDPLEECFTMWGRKLGMQLNPRLGDYGQVFQTLLQTNSVFDGASDTNVCLISLEDWLPDEPKPRVPSDEVLDEHIGELARISLPDGRTIASLNQYETEYLYREIVIDKAYKRYDIVLQDNDTVLDIGANIGMFTMFAAQQADNIKVVSIEPSPAVLPILRANAAMYAPDSIVIGAGASDKKSEAEFTAYKKSSVFSSFSANADDDHDAIAQIIRNTLEASGYTDEELLNQAVDELMTDRVQSERYMCPLVSVSDVIDEQDITQIGLLKIDAEKSEEAILAGIKDHHWPIVEQVIIEVHKQSGIGVQGVLDLMEKHGFICTEDEEQLLEDSGLVTLYAVRPERLESNRKLLPAHNINETAELFHDAMGTYTQRSKNPVDVVLCPATTRDPSLVRVIDDIEQTIKTKYADNPLVDVSNWASLAAHYPVESVSDDVSNELGHIPYTKEWYSATSTAILRKHLARRRAPCKVIVLDCDNTLWGGVAGEDGAAGVEITDNHRALHAFVKNQMAEGMLVCLASKNEESDVREVFENRSADMLLGWSDITAHRVNWERKSQNLREMAGELNVGVDSFIFIDDSPIECAEVRAECPEVLTLQLPTPDTDYTKFLQHVWSFDKTALTDADRKRAQMYQRERERSSFRDSAGSFEEFLSGLKLVVEISPVGAAELASSISNDYANKPI